MKSTLTLAAIAVTVCTLTACGGGGGDDSHDVAPDTSQPGTTQPDTADSKCKNTPITPASAASDQNKDKICATIQSPTYEALPAVDGPGITRFLDLLNQEGAKGYRYLSDYSFSADGNTVIGSVSIPGVTKSIFVHDGLASTYTYEALSSAGTMAGLVDQANAEGAKGYRYEGDISPTILNPTLQDLQHPAVYSLYRKDGGSTATYTYVTDSMPSSAAGFLDQANYRGQSGYWFHSSNGIPTTGATNITFQSFNLYMKNNASGAKYAYETLPSASTLSSLLDHFNSEGSRGYRARGGYMFSGQTYEVYIKDKMQSATFSWQDTTPQASSSGFVDQANRLATQGYAYFGTTYPDVNGIPSANLVSLYFKANNCSGFLCKSLNPLTQN